MTYRDDLPALEAQRSELQKELAALDARIAGTRARRAGSQSRAASLPAWKRHLRPIVLLTAYGGFMAAAIALSGSSGAPAPAVVASSAPEPPGTAPPVGSTEPVSDEVAPPRPVRRDDGVMLSIVPTGVGPRVWLTVEIDGSFSVFAPTTSVRPPAYGTLDPADAERLGAMSARLSHFMAGVVSEGKGRDYEWLIEFHGTGDRDPSPAEVEEVIQRAARIISRPVARWDRMGGTRRGMYPIIKPSAFPSSSHPPPKAPRPAPASRR